MANEPKGFGGVKRPTDIGQVKSSGGDKPKPSESEAPKSKSEEPKK